MFGEAREASRAGLGKYDLEDRDTVAREHGPFGKWRLLRMDRCREWRCGMHRAWGHGGSPIRACPGSPDSLANILQQQSDEIIFAT